jgi:DNA ligase (NAD+)
MSNRFDLEQQYMAAKEAYYSGTPILTDDEFDRLEADLLSLGSDVPYIVGADDRKAKYSHPSPMLSLAKYQASLDGNPPTESAVAWMNKFGSNSFEYTPKYDGNAANAIYVDGSLSQVLTRGNGNKGRDITDKVKHNLPETIDLSGTVEVRGEVVIRIATFNSKYASFKNPRNYVAGVLNRDENPTEVIQDLDFIPLEVRQHKDGEIIYVTPRVPGFKHTAHIFYGGASNFEAAYKDMVDYRKTSEYQLDGFVIKAPEGLRPVWGENSHDPNWAVAIKFPPKEAVTTIKSISWQYGKTGAVTPVAVMEPVDLDGSTVSRAALFNYTYLKNMGAYPGAQVAIAKSGDIIPQILRVISPGNVTEFEHPSHCKCGSELVKTGVHLMCENESCYLLEWHKFYQGVAWLDLDGVGGSMIKQLFSVGYRSGLELLNPNKFNKEILISKGFKDGKILANMLEQLARIKEITPKEILMILASRNMGRTTATQIGNYISGVDYSFHGLEKAVVNGYEPGQPKRIAYENAVAEISKYIKVVLPEAISKESISFEMTGSPKGAGFKTKQEFIESAKAKGYHHTGLKDAKVLFTDDLNSTSSKMAEARKKGIRIISYSVINEG